MSAPAQPPPSRLAWVRAQPGWVLALIGVAVLGVYHNALSTPFVFDDQFAVVDNPSIRHLARLGEVLAPPTYATGAVGRPLVNLSLALNYAVGQLRPWGYHAANVGLHLLAAAVLFGLVRRTLLKVGRKDATELAGVATLVWAVHPLLTESVTGVIQRNEVMGALFSLATLYGLARATEAAGSRGWLWLGWLACLMGMTAKETVATTPLLALLYDRTFVAGSFRAAWARRRGWYLALAANWLPLAWLMAGSSQRGGSVGFGLGVSSWNYLLTQCRALALYLKLAVWPHPLVLDYGTDLVRGPGDVWRQGGLILGLLGLTGWALWRRPPLGFLGAAFFVILAPSSSIVPLVSQPIAEHRMYLPLAALVVLAVLGLARLGGWRALLAGCLAAAALGAATVGRNADYRNELILVQGSLAANPHNDRAYLNLGTIASRRGQLPEAIAAYREALRYNVSAADTHFDLGAVLEAAGRTDEAIAEYAAAVRLRPGYPIAQYRLGQALARAGRAAEALGPLEAARRLQPDSPGARLALARVHAALGNTSAQAGRMPEALSQYERAVALDPDSPSAQNNLGNVWAALGRPGDAIDHYQAAVRLDPQYAEAHYNLAQELLEANRPGEARVQLQEVVRLRPDDREARQNLERIDAGSPR